MAGWSCFISVLSCSSFFKPHWTWRNESFWISGLKYVSSRTSVIFWKYGAMLLWINLLTLRISSYSELHSSNKGVEVYTKKSCLMFLSKTYSSLPGKLYSMPYTKLYSSANNCKSACLSSRIMLVYVFRILNSALFKISSLLFSLCFSLRSMKYFVNSYS